MKIRDVEIGSGRTYVVAEMAWSHDGKKELALDIVRGTKQAGADCLSVHVTDVAAYMVPHYGSGEGRVSKGKESEQVFRYLDNVNIRTDWWPDIIAATRDADLALAVMPNDAPSLEISRSFDPDLYVLSAACFVEESFVRAVAREGKPVLLRVGGATLGEIETVIGWLRAEHNESYIILYGQQNYPTRIEDTDLLKLRTLADTFGCPVGLADHIDAEDPLCTQIPFMALPLGAQVIEKHITHNRALKGEDHESALNPDEFADFVKRLRQAELALGNPAFRGLSDSGRRYRQVARKRVVAARDIAQGTVLADADLTCKRADFGEFPDRLELLLGRVAGQDLLANEGVTLSALH